MLRRKSRERPLVFNIDVGRRQTLCPQSGRLRPDRGDQRASSVSRLWPDVPDDRAGRGYRDFDWTSGWGCLRPAGVANKGDIRFARLPPRRCGSRCIQHRRHEKGGARAGRQGGEKGKKRRDNKNGKEKREQGKREKSRKRKQGRKKRRRRRKRRAEGGRGNKGALGKHASRCCCWERLFTSIPAPPDTRRDASPVWRFFSDFGFV